MDLIQEREEYTKMQKSEIKMMKAHESIVITKQLGTLRNQINELKIINFGQREKILILKNEQKRPKLPMK